MGKGISRAYVAAAGMVQAMIGNMANAKLKTGENIFSQSQLAKAGERAAKNLRKLAGGGRIQGRYDPHQGAQECARRVRQGVNGTTYVHGAQYRQ